MANSNINKHLEAKEQRLGALEEGLKQLQEELKNLQQQLRIESQIHKAQQTIASEFESQKKAFRKLLRDACSCYGAEAMDDFLMDMAEIAEDVKNNHEEYQNSDRFLNLEGAEEEDQYQDQTEKDMKDYPMLISSDEIPNKEDDTTPLQYHHVEQLLEGVDLPELNKIQMLLGVSTRVRTLPNIYQQFVDAGITRKKLEDILSLIVPLAHSSNGTPPALIGSSNNQQP